MTIDISQELIDFAETIKCVNSEQGEKLDKPMLNEIDRISKVISDIATSHLVE